MMLHRLRDVPGQQQTHGVLPGLTRPTKTPAYRVARPLAAAPAWTFLGLAHFVAHAVQVEQLVAQVGTRVFVVLEAPIYVVTQGARGRLLQFAILVLKQRVLLAAQV